jgi:hypothetical protein
MIEPSHEHPQAGARKEETEPCTYMCVCDCYFISLIVYWKGPRTPFALSVGRFNHWDAALPPISLSLSTVDTKATPLISWTARQTHTHTHNPTQTSKPHIMSQTLDQETTLPHDAAAAAPFFTSSSSFSSSLFFFGGHSTGAGSTQQSATAPISAGSGSLPALHRSSMYHHPSSL